MAEAIAHPEIHGERLSAELILGGALAETITGASVVVISIIGLSGFMPGVMLSIATIGLGLSFLFEGGAVASRLSNLLSEATEDRVDIAELGGGLSAEFIAGFGGVALGILSLAGVATMILTPIAAIAFGVALVMGSGVKARVNHLRISNRNEPKLVRQIAREALIAASGVEILVGMGAIALGILGVIGIHPMELSLVAILSVGGMALFGGTALGGRMLSLFRK
jgi:hypothetical protein